MKLCGLLFSPNKLITDSAAGRIVVWLHYWIHVLLLLKEHEQAVIIIFLNGNMSRLLGQRYHCMIVVSEVCHVTLSIGVYLAG